MSLDKQEIDTRLAKFKKVLRENKLPITPQKIAIFQALASSCSHPDIQEIYKLVKADFPNISLATVYSNLKKFQTLSLLIEIHISGEQSRYDAKMERHSHAVDTASKCIYDIENDQNLLLPGELLGKTVKRVDIIYHI